ncbi:unnamed protein product [Owenia fusiformis]|uniref:Tyrosine-protein kinase n=1 Tax=Owenia fusiformis TaxID=6347 RepID=A0A8J1XUZ1_OWEFU|nr:unnamed protein product [Owenia fusiformis]
MSHQGQVHQEHWSPGTEVVALYNFQGNSSEDLPFQKRDTLSILRSTRDPNWYQARLNGSGREGMIPANYVQVRGEVKLHAMPWFHGKIPRDKAEELLQPRSDGLFLVRESTNYPGDYTLCVCFGDKVEHYHIEFKNGRLTIDDEEFFDNLTELVEHYDLRGPDGLCCKLTIPVKKQGKLAMAVDQKQFKASGWAIKLKEITLGDTIGKGEYGDVYKGEFRGQKVAVKAMKDSTKAAQQFLAEASLMTSLKHPNLVQLLGVVLGENASDTIYIVTEFMSKGSLVEYLRTRGRQVITKQNQINFACDTCAGMAYLDEKNLVHRDLAARNVLISEDDRAKISDFGLARYEDTNQEGGRFPIKWTSPEALRDSKFTSKSDMWSFGILLWEIYSFGRVPYPRIPLANVVQHVERGYRMESPDGCPKEVYDIMRKAWELDPRNRPTFAQTLPLLDRIRKNAGT